MAVDALLQSTTPVSKGGVLTASSRGQMCYDLGALTIELQKRYVLLLSWDHDQMTCFSSMDWRMVVSQASEPANCLFIPCCG